MQRYSSRSVSQEVAAVEDMESIEDDFRLNELFDSGQSTHVGRQGVEADVACRPVREEAFDHPTTFVESAPVRSFELSQSDQPSRVVRAVSQVAARALGRSQQLISAFSRGCV